MNYEEAKRFLNQFVREESGDLIFGDKEVCWYHPFDDSINQNEIAIGYTDGKFCEVVVEQSIFVGHQAETLLMCGSLRASKQHFKEFHLEEEQNIERINGVRKEVVFK